MSEMKLHHPSSTHQPTDQVRKFIQSQRHTSAQWRSVHHNGPVQHPQLRARPLGAKLGGSDGSRKPQPLPNGLRSMDYADLTSLQSVHSKRSQALRGQEHPRCRQRSSATSPASRRQFERHQLSSRTQVQSQHIPGAAHASQPRSDSRSEPQGGDRASCGTSVDVR